MTQQELDDLQAKALEQFKSGTPLFGKGGAFAPMLKQFLEAALEAEMQAHLDPEERQRGNSAMVRAPKALKALKEPSRSTRLRIAKALSNHKSSRSGKPSWQTTFPAKSLAYMGWA